jgi:hypothetical protein
MQAGLEFLDGKHAGVGEGMRLHRTVVYNTANRAIHNCVKGNRGHTFFISGNERSVVDLSVNGYVIISLVSLFVLPDRNW